MTTRAMVETIGSFPAMEGRPAWWAEAGDLVTV